MRSVRPTPDEVRRILIVRLSSLGDIVHALPAVHNLHAASGAEVDWLVHPEYASLVRHCPDVTTVLEWPRHATWITYLRHVRALRARTYDLVVDLQGLLKSALPARLARARWRLGPSYHREGAHWFYGAVAGPRNKARHAVEENLDVVRYLSWPETPVEFPLKFSPSPAPGMPPRVAMVPAARWPTKNWPVPFFATLAWELARRGVTVYLFGSASQEPLCVQIKEQASGHPAIHVLAGHTSLPQLGALLNRCELAITVDTGPMHLAAALGVPVIALFGPTDPVRTGPYGPRHRVLLAPGDLHCRPCFSDQCSRGDLACLRNIFPSRVLNEALRILERREDVSVPS